MDAHTSTTGQAITRGRSTVLAYFGVDANSASARAAFYGRIVGRVAIIGAFLAGIYGYIAGLGLLL